MSHSLALLCTGYLGPSAVPFADRDLALALQCSVLQDAQLGSEGKSARANASRSSGGTLAKYVSGKTVSKDERLE